ncbi:MULTISPECIES: alpha/beta fold hydrolase [unclassified Crossiella]|uniref:alpha/beta fold hydrolase n=1 Tax=unclassified Crossiella TaxID=2620835 RepID=UPI001FFE78EE|nr:MULTISPECIES: alpha/beta hydrolase [unclassified Crossiella]MCK2238711.1 alpha/beta hydrolase [Crossiella sp. S99.2]MCK2251719.1 alpha/beta hydrolase [Crossiella sp. S99.1]
MIESTVDLQGRRFGHVDFGGPGRPVLALHGSFGRGSQFARLAAELGEEFRVLALDQRGHGNSAHGGDFGRAEFVADAAEFLRHLDLGPLPVLGHSLGGLNAFQLAARHPDLVSSLIVEDFGAVMRTPEVEHPELDLTGWPLLAGSAAELRAAVARLVPVVDYFMASAIETAQGWRLCFDYADLAATQRGGLGDHWPDWLAVRCPILLLRGQHSPMLPAALAADMVRPGVELVELPGCGHWIHDDDPAGFAAAVRGFLRRTG